MDPDANWKELSETITLIKQSDNSRSLVTVLHKDRLIELAESLRDWLDKGGFPPNISDSKEFDRFVARATCQEIFRFCGKSND